MIIGIDIRTLMDKHYSGVSEYTLKLLKELFKLDSKNEYRLFYNSFSDIGERMRKFEDKNAKLYKYNYPNKILNYIFFKFLGRPKIDERLGADIFFMPHINFIGLSSPKSGNKAKKIITIHDLSFLRYPEFYSCRKNFWHKMINIRKLSSKFDSIIAVSENTKRDIIDLCGFEESKIKVVYSGIGEEYRKLSIGNNKPMFDKIKNKYNLPDRFILFLGTLEPRKNIDGLIRAYNQLRISNYELRDYKLVVAGAKGWKCRKIFKNWQESPYKKDINFLGYVPDDEKVFLYNLASLFIYPSFYEGFGFPPLEAMASGTPVITSNVSSLPEITGSAAILVDPYNISDISRAIEEVLTDEAKRKDLSKKGIERSKDFSWGHTAKRYLEIMGSV